MKSHALSAACLILFPLLFIVFAGSATGVHPDPSGDTAADQVRAVAAALGVAGGGMTAGILTMEAGLVAPVTETCAGSGACLSPSNEPFLGELAEVSWQSIPYLSYTAGSLVFALAFLAVLGWRATSVRAWEAALIVVGVVGVYATNTILHGDAWYGLALGLLASASIAARMVRRAVPAA
jgi:hypothetical protein